MQCAYESSSDCTAAYRALRRQRPAFLSGCWLSTADPTYVFYGKWVLEYYL
jgi:hypothetical protein